MQSDNNVYLIIYITLQGKQCITLAKISNWLCLFNLGTEDIFQFIFNAIA